MTWTFEWRHSWLAVWQPDLQEAWRSALDNGGRWNVFQEPELVRAWVETRGAALNARPMVGLATDQAGRRVVLPWQVVDYGGRFIRRRVVEPLGGSFFCYQHPIAEQADSINWPAFWDAVRESVRSSCDQALLRFVHPCYAEGAYSAPCGEEYPLLELAGATDLDAVLLRCSANHRGDVRRRLRRLNEKGEVRLWVAGPCEVSAALDDFDRRFLPAYAALWESRTAGNQFLRPGVADFVRTVIRHGLPAGWAHYTVLKVGGSAIAWHIGLVGRREFYWWIPTYDRTWEQWSPGKVLLGMLIDHGIRQGWTRWHFLTGGHRYKLEWNPAMLHLRSVRWYSPTAKGRLIALYDRCCRSLRSSPRRAAHDIRAAGLQA
jgi:CelD/BcsL family acetyltransferase involved in cellulose biosynthesis